MIITRFGAIYPPGVLFKGVTLLASFYNINEIFKLILF
jgi:hypothetical protein